MASVKQHADGSLSVFSDTEQKSLWRVGGPTTPAVGGSDQNYRAPFTIKIPLNTSGGGSAALAAWQNTSGDDLLVGLTRVDMTTGQTASMAISVGTSTTNVTLDLNLIDSCSVSPTATLYDNITDKGTAGKSRQKLTNNSWITCSTGNSTASAVSFRGTLYLDVIKA